MFVKLLLDEDNTGFGWLLNAPEKKSTAFNCFEPSTDEEDPNVETGELFFNSKPVAITVI